jgi:hypothetical protein
MKTLRLLFLGACIALSSGLFASESGFALGSVNLGYMSQNEFAERVSVDEVSGYINRLRAKCTELYAGDIAPRQFYAVVVVHSGHSHVWIVDASGAKIAGAEEKEKKLQEVPIPAVPKFPIAFALDARIAGGKPEKEGGAPPVPAKWREAISKSKPSGPLRFDDVIRLVCVQ